MGPTCSMAWYLVRIVVAWERIRTVGGVSDMMERSQGRYEGVETVSEGTNRLKEKGINCKD